MRFALSTLLIALVLVVSGVLLLGAARFDLQVADAQEALVLGRHAEAATGLEEALNDLGWASALPWLSGANEIQVQQTAARYWQRDYEELVKDDPTPAQVAEQLVLANATYRAGQQKAVDRETSLSALDAGIEAYRTLLKNTATSGGASAGAGAGEEDAAFNYEVLVRLRTRIEAGKGQIETDETRGSQGQMGAPPPLSEGAAEFEIYIPLETEELDKVGGGAGKGEARKRKG